MSKLKNICKHGINKNSMYRCASCDTGSKYYVKRKYIRKNK